MALITFVAPIRTYEQSVVEKGLYKVFSSRPMNGCAATVWATSRMSSIKYEFHVAPLRRNGILRTAVAKGAEAEPNGG
jgi:hypothetical protein